MEKQRKKRENEAHCATHRPRRLLWAYFRVADLWARAILSNPATVVRNIRGEKGSVEIEASLFIRSARFGALRPAGFPKILYPAKSGIHISQSRPRSRTLIQHSSHDAASSVDNSLNGSRRLSRR